MDECENKVIKPYKLTAFEDDDFLNIRANMVKLHYDNEWKNKKGNILFAKKVKLSVLKFWLGYKFNLKSGLFLLPLWKQHVHTRGLSPM